MMDAVVQADGTPRVRVVVVDDQDDIRTLLRLQLSRDRRFEVVGEAADGVQAVRVAEEMKPDLLILDRQMPNASGLEVLPDIRKASPDTAVIMYTANADPVAYEAAIDAGALDVLEKAGTGGFVERLVAAIAEPAAADASVEISVGPVSSQAARVWVKNSTAVLEAAVAHPEISGAQMPVEVLQLLRSFLREWGKLADTTDEFRWIARASPRDVRRIIEAWAVVDGMTDEQIEQLGVHWAPPEGRPFFEALASGVLLALRQHDETQRLASRLADQFAPFIANET